MFDKLKSLLGMEKPKEMFHPTFGKLLYFDLQDPAKNYWEGEVAVEGHPEPVTLAIEAGESGPTEAQERFFRLIAGDFSRVILKCSKIMKTDYQQWCAKPYPTDFMQEFRWVGLTIPRNGDETNLWDISFDCLSDAEHHFVVYFENGQAVTCSIDG